MRRNSRFVALVLGLCFACCLATSAIAFPVTWTLSGATFGDGGTASGSFVYDADTNTLSNWSVSVAGGNTGTFPAVTYDTTTSQSLIAGQGTSGVGIMFCIGGTCAGNVRQLRMPAASPLTDAGGTIGINLSSPAQAECFNCSPYRQFNAGSLVGTASPSITSASNTAFSVGTPGTFTVTSTGAPVAALSEAGTLPSGVTFTDNGDGTATLAGTPAAGTGGTYPITITASNGVAPDATQNFTLTVNVAPTITSANSATFTAGAAGSFTVTTTGLPTPALTESGTLPSGVTFTDNGNGTAALTGTPAAGTGGTYAITFTASNGVAPDATQNFTLTVDEAPAITSASNTTFQNGVAGSFTVTTTGIPAPALTVSGTLPSGVTFTDNGNGTATLSGTSTASGTYNLTVTANNGIAPNATQAFTLVVQAPVPVTSTPGLTAAGMLLLGLLLLLAGLAAQSVLPRRE
jgi:hypothetical protein